MRPLVLSLILLLALLHTGLNSDAQNASQFADSNATWHFLKASYPMSAGGSIRKSTEVYQVVGKATLNNKIYQLIQQQDEDQETIFIRQDTSGKVYFLDDNYIEKFLFDFSLNQGDTITVNQQNDSGNNTLTFQADSVDTVDIAGPKKRIIPDAQPSEEIWVEGIGFFNSVGCFRHPFSRYSVYDGPVCELLCYSEGDSVYYQHPGYNTCQFDTTIDVSVREPSNGEIAVEPNPACDRLRVSSSSSLSLSPLQSIELVNLTGQVVLRKALDAHDQGTSVTIEHIPSGMYICRIVGNDGERFMKKVMVSCGHGE